MRIITLLPALLLLCGTAQAQCPDCTPDTGCSISPAFPTLCPLTPPDATVGIPYSTVITFWMPPSFTDPGTGATVDFQQMTITNVEGLPFGLDITYSHADGVYHPQLEQHGCAHICGTPLTAGTYPITISVLAGVSFSGINLNVPQSFTLYLNVLPGSGGNAGFTFTPSSGCGSTSVGFQALIDGSPSPTSYAWDLGDGSTSTDAAPVHVYDQPGEYVITLQTSIGGFVLDQVELTGVNGNWCGDVEEPNLPFVGCQGAPDPYFVLTDGQGGTYTSSTVDNATTGTWTGLGVAMNEPPYSISFYDEDAVSANDLLGTFNLPSIGAGAVPFNVAGGTTGQLSISAQVQQTFTHTDTVRIHPVPDAVLAEGPAPGQLCLGDSTLAAYIWLLDGDTVPGLNSPCITPTGPGEWQATVVNAFGCSATSNTVIVCPEIAITQNGPVLQVPSGLGTYAWTFEGDPVGGNDPFLVILGDGLYGVTVTGADGCIMTATFLLSTTGIAGNGPAALAPVIFPVPNRGEFTVVAQGLHSSLVGVEVLDPMGRCVHRTQAAVVRGMLRTGISAGLAPGHYLLRLEDGSRWGMARFVVH